MKAASHINTSFLSIPYTRLESSPPGENQGSHGTQGKSTAATSTPASKKWGNVAERAKSDAIRKRFNVARALENNERKLAALVDLAQAENKSNPQIFKALTDLPQRKFRFWHSENSELHDWKRHTGTITRDHDNGSLSCKDNPFLHQVCQVLNKNAASSVSQIEIPETGEMLTFSMPVQGLEDCWKAFEDYSDIKQITLLQEKGSTVTVKKDVVEEDDDGNEQGISVLIPTLIRARDEGRKAFKSDAVIEAPTKDTASSSNAENTMHPYDLLASVKPVIACNHKDLKELMRQQLSENPDYCARTTAAYLLEKATTTEYALLPLAMSASLSAVAGYLLEELAGEYTLKAIFKDALAMAGLSKVTEQMLQEATSLEKFLTILAQAYPTLPVEAGDTLIVLWGLDKINGKPVTAKKVFGRLPSAIKAGLISFLFALPDKAVQFIKADSVGKLIGKTILGSLTSQASALACGSGLFFELHEEKSKLEAALFDAHQSGYLAMPDHVDTNDGEAIKKYIRELTEKTLNTSPSKIGRASIPGAMALGVAAAVASLGVPERVMNVLKIIFFNPVEAWTLNMNVFLDKWTHDANFKSHLLELANQMEHGEITPLKAETEILSKIGGMVIEGAYSVGGGIVDAGRYIASFGSAKNKRIEDCIPYARFNQLDEEAVSEEDYV